MLEAAKISINTREYSTGPHSVTNLCMDNIQFSSSPSTPEFDFPTGKIAIVHLSSSVTLYRCATEVFSYDDIILIGATLLLMRRQWGFAPEKHSPILCTEVYLCMNH